MPEVKLIFLLLSLEPTQASLPEETDLTVVETDTEGSLMEGPGTPKTDAEGL